MVERVAWCAMLVACGGRYTLPAMSPVSTKLP